jgi:hypothetical protein
MAEYSNILDAFYEVERLQRENDYNRLYMDEPDYHVLRDSLVDTILSSMRDEAVDSTLRRKTSIPYNILSPLVHKEIEHLTLAFLDPDNSVPDESKDGTQGLLLILQGSFAKGFGYGVQTNRGVNPNHLVDKYRDQEEGKMPYDEDSMEAMKDIMGGVDMDSLRVVAEVLSVVEAALVAYFRPDSLNGPLTQTWLWGFITGWEYDMRKALAGFDL